MISQSVGAQSRKLNRYSETMSPTIATLPSKAGRVSAVGLAVPFGCMQGTVGFLQKFSGTSASELGFIFSSSVSLKASSRKACCRLESIH